MPRRRKRKTQSNTGGEKQKPQARGQIWRPPSPFEYRMARMSERLSRIPMEGIERALLQRQMDMDVAFQVRWKEFKARIPHWLRARILGGSGLQMANTLRAYFYEYASRSIEHGFQAFPLSFNVVESFLSAPGGVPVYELNDEYEHLLALDDYFDWYTAGDMPGALSLLIDVMTEGLIYSFNMVHETSGFRLSTPDSELIIAGISFIRHGDELSCVLVAGESPAHPSDAEVREMIASPLRSAPGRENITSAESWTVNDRYLNECPGYARVHLLTRFDLQAAQYRVRYICLDCGPTYTISTDDPDCFDDGDDFEERKDGLSEELQRYNDLFSAAAALMFLPVYIIEQMCRISEITVKTELYARKDEAQVQDTLRVMSGECALERRIHCIRSKETTGTSHEIIPPDLQFASSGYWKPITPGQVGEDESGNPIIGKTWVSRHETWMAKGPSTFLVHRSQSPPAGPNPGTVYVMRSPGHAQDVFKIGHTKVDAEARAKGLYRTGVPLPFGVLATWDVADCIAIEKAAHERLAPYRINPNREFFKTELKIIISAIKQIVQAADS